jgi:hypothetical protein
MLRRFAMLQPIPAAGGGGSSPNDAPGSVHIARFGDNVESLLERFGLHDDVSRKAFFELNPRLAAGGLVIPGVAVRVPAPAMTVSQAASVGSSIDTSWTKGYGRSLAGQNDYNDAIRAAQDRCPGGDPLILKSILAQETGFREGAFASNAYGYAGVAQLGIDEAHEAGLRTGASRARRRGHPPVYDRANDERFDPSKAVPAAAVVLRNKERALQSGVTLQSGRRLSGYDTYGEPRGDDRWRFAAAAYNGGQGTILRAMRNAYGDVRPAEVRWADLVRSPSGSVRDTPLWRAIVEVGMNPTVKYREISEYAANVVARARQ